MKPEDFRITKYKWNNGKLDCFQSVDLEHRKLTKLPFKFGIVEGWFECSNNNLTSLEGCPSSVGGSFYCFNNKLTSLRGAPKTVKGSFYCHSNRLTTLDGISESVGGYIYHHDNPVKFSARYVEKAQLKTKMDFQDIKEQDLNNIMDIMKLHGK